MEAHSNILNEIYLKEIIRILNIVICIVDQDNHMSLWFILIRRIFLLLRYFEFGDFYTQDSPKQTVSGSREGLRIVIHKCPSINDLTRWQLSRIPRKCESGAVDDKKTRNILFNKYTIPRYLRAASKKDLDYAANRVVG